MRIGVVGGLVRNARRYVELCRARGHEVEFHDGSVTGRGRDAIASLVDRVDVVIVQTEVNSHGAMWSTRAEARRVGRPLLILRRLGITAFARLLDGLDDGVRVVPAL
jgi:hypothetical protein